MDTPAHSVTSPHAALGRVRAISGVMATAGVLIVLWFLAKGFAGRGAFLEVAERAEKSAWWMLMLPFAVYCTVRAFEIGVAPGAVFRGAPAGSLERSARWFDQHLSRGRPRPRALRHARGGHPHAALQLALGELSLGQNERVVADVGMASISFFSVIMAVFLGASLLYKEIERKTLYVILPKPIARYEFLLGKYFGIVATAGVFVAIMGGVQLLFFGEVIVLSAVALLFSSFSTPFLTGVFTLGIWILGRSADEMAGMKSKAIREEVQTMLHGLAHVVPNFNLYVPGRHTLSTYHATFGGDFAYVAQTMGYTVLYATVILMLAAAIFRRRDFL
jgi:hypothetical protein